MSQVKYNIYTYQLRPVNNIQYDLFEGGMTKETIWEKKNLLFFQMFDSEIPFYHRRKN